MTDQKFAMNPVKKIALVAHDNKKQTLVEWSRFNRDLLVQHKVFATGTTGKILEEVLDFKISEVAERAVGGRPANRRQDRRGEDRLHHLLLGSPGAAAA